jgi:uncharacterized protein (TIGR00730 family)
MANICVFAGSTRNVGSSFYNSASDLGKVIGERGHILVYGGSDRGLMGAVASSTINSGGKIIEVIPKTFANVALRKGELIIVEDLRDRKAKMWEISDGFVALPGGFGTLDEIADVIATNIIANEEHKPMKPLVFLDTFDFYYALLDHFKGIYEENFAPADTRRLYSVIESPSQAVDFIEKYVQPRLKSKADHIEGK